jgi:hypothetical protein
MAYTRADVTVLCPFFVEAAGKTLTCNGGLTKECRTVSEFSSREERGAYMRERCRHAFCLCPLATAISSMYNYEIPRDRECKAE